MKSIYEQIQEAVGPDGTLPGGFDLEQEELSRSEDSQAGPTIRFAPGAEDGICYYHGGWGPDQEQLAQMVEATRLIANEETASEGIDKLLDCFAERDGMISCVDGLQGWIIEHQEELDLGRLFYSASVLLTASGSVGMVKYALSVLELAARVEGEWQDHVRTLALFDEFTLFCVWVARHWENWEVFAMAQKVKGWGRVHAVRELEASTQEVRDWLLDEGWDNDVLPAYTALDCAQKGGLRQRLEGETLSREQLDAAGGLIRALLDEGPVRNISQMEDAEELLLAWLDQVERAGAGEEDEKTLESLREEAGERDWPRLWARLDAQS